MIMNDVRDKEATDRLVSETYRDLADERAPRPLDEKVLQMAAAAKPAPSLAPGGWMKPVAWAATIGLSLAIVLELTQMPQTRPEMDSRSPAPAADERVRPAPDGVKPPPGSGFDDRPDRPIATESSIGAEPNKTARPQDKSMERRAVKPDVHRAEMPVTRGAPAQAMTLAPEALATTGGAAGVAEAVPASQPDPVPSMAVSADGTLMAGPRLCPASARETAEAWYECIEQNRAANPATVIEREIEALRARFPDYPIPDADK
jgi:hypothetical protein